MKVTSRGMKKFVFFVCLLLMVGASALLYGMSSVGKGIFLSTSGRESAVLGQFTEMIIHPAGSLKGEAEGRINLLLLGVGGEGHDGGGLTDTIIIMSLKPQTKETALISIPRDLYVEVEGTDIRGKINALKAQGDARTERNGSELLRQEVEKLSGLPIHYYAQLDFAGFTKAVDAVGGIDVYLEKAIDDPLYPNFTHGYDPFQIAAGWHHLDGATALKVVRSRHGSSDFDRSARQQEVIKAFRQKVFEKYKHWDVGTLSSLFASFSGNLQTDIEPKELPRFYQIFKELKNQNFKTEAFTPANYLQKVNKGYGYTLGLNQDQAEAAQIMTQNIFAQKISPTEKIAITQENARVEIQSASDNPDLANRVTEDLEKVGIRVIKSANVQSTGQEETPVQIQVQNSDRFPTTQNFLSRAFGAPLTKKPMDDYVDIVIVLGKSF